MNVTPRCDAKAIQCGYGGEYEWIVPARLARDLELELANEKQSHDETIALLKANSARLRQNTDILAVADLALEFAKRELIDLQARCDAWQKCAERFKLLFTFSAFKDQPNVREAIVEFERLQNPIPLRREAGRGDDAAKPSHLNLYAVD